MLDRSLGGETGLSRFAPRMHPTNSSPELLAFQRRGTPESGSGLGHTPAPVLQESENFSHRD
jgi:hypothetical protein